MCDVLCVRTGEERDVGVFCTNAHCGSRTRRFSTARSNNCVRSPSCQKSLGLIQSVNLSELKPGMRASEQCVNAVKNIRVVRCLSTDLSDTERDTWISSSLAHHCPHLEVPPHGTNLRESRALSLVPVGLRLVYLHQRQLQR